jgi:hypothetical protein
VRLYHRKIFCVTKTVVCRVRNGHVKNMLGLTQLSMMTSYVTLFSLNLFSVVKIEDQFGFYDIFIIITKIRNVKLLLKCLKG